MESRRELAENALKGIVKLIKAVRFYPAGHPALKTTVAETRKALRELLEGRRSVSLEVRKEGLQLEGEPVGAGHSALGKLAAFLFLRRVHALTLLPDPDEGEILAFVRVISRDPAALQAAGGLQEALFRQGVSSFWVNEVDLESILAKRQQLEQEQETAAAGTLPEVPEAEGASGPKQPEEAPEGSRTLRKVLEELRRTESDRRFQALLRELVPLLRKKVEAGDGLRVLQVFYLLCRYSADRAAPRQRRQMVRQLLPRLLDEPSLDLLIGLLVQPGLAAEQRERVTRVLTYLRSGPIAARLMHHLASSDQAQSRKYLAQALVRLGPAATPTLVEHLQDERWYVVRNSAVILGELRDPEVTGRLLPLLDHADLRVRRETMRALTKIGGPEAVGAFLQILAGKDEDLRRQALLSLGALKNPAAVPALLKLLHSPDSWVRQAEVIKEAIRALGGIGADEAVPDLVALLRRRKWWRRGLYDQLRAAAALALGEIGAADARPALEEAVEDRSQVVARAAVQALKQYRRGV